MCLTSNVTSQKKILVTGSGGPAGIAVINELRKLGYFTIGVDADPYAAGIRLADLGLTVPRVDSAGYLDRLLEVVGETAADAIVSTMTEELSVLTAPDNLGRLEDAGVAHWFPPKSAVDACMDKREFAAMTEAAHQPVPLTGSGSVDDALDKVPGPWIIKPCFGRGSRDVYTAETAEEVREIWPRVPVPILQTRLSGQEFTIDVLIDRNGELAGGVPRYRLATKAGISTVGRTFEAPGLLEFAESLLNSIGHTGPANVQGFIDFETGDLGFIEINPRFSGGLPLSLGAGADLVGQFAVGMFGGEIDRAALSYVPGTVMVRYFEESFFVEEVEPVPFVRPIARS